MEFPGPFTVELLFAFAVQQSKWIIISKICLYVVLMLYSDSTLHYHALLNYLYSYCRCGSQTCLSHVYGTWICTNSSSIWIYKSTSNQWQKDDDAYHIYSIPLVWDIICFMSCEVFLLRINPSTINIGNIIVLSITFWKLKLIIYWSTNKKHDKT